VAVSVQKSVSCLLPDSSTLLEYMSERPPSTTCTIHPILGWLYACTRGTPQGRAVKLV